MSRTVDTEGRRTYDFGMCPPRMSPHRPTSSAKWAASTQDLDILLECPRAYRLALVQQRDATTGKIKTIVTRVGDQTELLELIVRHAVGVNEVTHINHISLEQLVERLVSSKL
jgi:hypothetical protein